MGFMKKLKRGFSKSKDFVEDTSFKVNLGILKAKSKYNEQQETTRIKRNIRLDKEIKQQKKIYSLNKKERKLHSLKEKNKKYSKVGTPLGFSGYNTGVNDLGLQDPTLSKKKKKGENLFDLGL